MQAYLPLVFWFLNLQERDVDDKLLLLVERPI